MDDQVLNLIASRLQRIEKQNDDQLALLNEHLADDAKLRIQVDRHATYFKAASAFAGLGIPAMFTYLLTKLGLK